MLQVEEVAIAEPLWPDVFEEQQRVSVDGIGKETVGGIRKK